MQPKWYEYAESILRHLGTDGQPVAVSVLHEVGASEMSLSDEQRHLATSTGRRVYKDRVSWALTYMKFSDWVSTPKRAHWQITEKGRQRLQNGASITRKEMVNAKRAIQKARKQASSALRVSDGIAESKLTPRERIESGVDEIRSSVTMELLEKLRGNDPTFFEIAVLDVLRAMGYVGNLGRVEHAGKTGDDWTKGDEMLISSILMYADVRSTIS